MIQIRRAENRGRTRLSWLDSRHTFSFGQYSSARHRRFGRLRVLNEDHVQPGGGFGTHSHGNMEIITYIIDGALEHRDSFGSGSIIQRGEIQRMSAGTGVSHSEFNPSKDMISHFLQIWIEPDQDGLPPSYEQRRFPLDQWQGNLGLVVSPDGRDGSLKIRQDVSVYVALLEAGQRLAYLLPKGRRAWIQIVCGEVSVNDHWFRVGDGAAVSEEPELTISGRVSPEILLFDLPPSLSSHL